MSRANPLPQMTSDEIARFWSKVDKTGDCWIWTSAINADGYGHIRIAGAMRKAHRLAYCLTNGDVPADKQLHHACENRACVNPSHIVAMTPKEHTINTDWRGRKRPHCPMGHEMTDDNTLRLPNRHRTCRTCFELHKDEFGIVNGKNQFGEPSMAAPTRPRRAITATEHVAATLLPEQRQKVDELAARKTGGNIAQLIRGLIEEAWKREVAA